MRDGERVVCVRKNRKEKATDQPGRHMDAVADRVIWAKRGDGTMMKREKRMETG